jgi:hypothetical protein
MAAHPRPGRAGRRLPYDRPVYNLVEHLGMIPPDLALNAVEISW